MSVSGQGTRVPRSGSSAGRVVAATARNALLAVEVAQFGALTVVAALAYLGRRMLRRVNHRGILGWAAVRLAVLLLTALILELT